MAYRSSPSASEQRMLDDLRDRGVTRVTVAQLRRWYRNGAPQLPEQVADFAGLLDALGPRHTDHALLVVAGAWPEVVDVSKVSTVFLRWFERHFGAIADDPKRGAKTLYRRMSRLGGAQRRLLGLGRLGSQVARDLEAVGEDIHDDDYWPPDPLVPARFETREHLHRFALRLPDVRVKLVEATDVERLAAIRAGYLRAATWGRREDTPFHALDVLVGQDARRPMSKETVLVQLHRLAGTATGA